MESPLLQVDVVPDKGADILSARWKPLGIDLLWTSPWGLRQKDVPSTANDSVARFLESYPGGWQTIFPNGGDACVDEGLEFGFHGEACLVPWNVQDISADGEITQVSMSAYLPLSDFFMSKTITVEGGSVQVVESAQNRSERDREVMWSHHPAFGPPFLSEDCILGADAGRFVVDDARETPIGDLEPGSSELWPTAKNKAGDKVDLTSTLRELVIALVI